MYKQALSMSLSQWMVNIFFNFIAIKLAIKLAIHQGVLNQSTKLLKVIINKKRCINDIKNMCM